MPADHDGVQFSLLGPVRVRRRDGVTFRAGSPKQQAMLAALALAPGTAVSMNRLIEALWGADMPARAVSTVRTYAWRLRQVLAAAGAEVLLSVGDGYQLAVPASAVDVARAEELAAVAQRALAAGRPEDARQSLSEALALWTGEPLAGVPGLFAERSRDRLTELHAALTERYLETELQLGHYYEVQPRLAELIAEHPLREHLYVLLMRALYGMGRQIDALEVFRTARRLLVDAHGVEPGTELTTLHERILRGAPETVQLPANREETPTAAPPTLREPPPEPATGGWHPVPAQLPPDLPDFTGRARQQAALEAVLAATDRRTPAVLAITGMSGVGKTSLAVHIAHSVRELYPDGQLHVDLGDPDGVGKPLSSVDLLGLLLAGVGVPAGQLPAGLAERRGLLRSLVGGRRLLILLDNVSDCAQIRDALPGTPGCAVLITSRMRLDGLPMQVQLPLPVFEPDEALDLLRQGIGVQRLAAEHTEALALVATCGRLPLAIRIVAARLAARPRWSLRSMRERLEDERRRITELRAGPLAVAAVFEVGYRQLPAQPAGDFVLLAAVAGTEFALPEAAAVLGADPAEAEQRLELLVDAAMLDEPAPGRFRFHGLLWSFARSRDRDRRRETAALGRLLGLLSATARDAFAHAVPGDPIDDALGSGSATVPGLPLADLRAAREWAASTAATVVLVCAQVVELGDTELLRAAVDLLIALSPFADELRASLLAATAQELADAIALIPEPAADRWQAYHRTVGRVEFLRSTIALRTATPAEVESHARRAVAAATAGEDPVILRQALNDLGLAAELRHDYPFAVECFDRSTALAREQGHRSGEVASSVNAALARLRGGDPDTALATCSSALALADEIGDAAGTGYALYALGLVNHALGNHAAAVGHFTSCVARSRAANIREREAHARYRLAETLLALGRTEEAVTEADLAARQCAELGTERDQANALLVLGRALAQAGRPAEAVERLTHAWLIYDTLELPEAEEATRAVAAVTQTTR